MRFKLGANGLELVEVAPGIDIDRHILAHMWFKPLVRTPKLMDARISLSDPMRLRNDPLRKPL